MGFVTGAFPKDWWSGAYPPEYLQANWDRHKQWYAVLHRFDDEGNHIGSEIWSGGSTHAGQDAAIGRALRKLEEMRQGLGNVELCDIDVKPFAVEVDGYLFGLIYELKNYDDPANPEGTYEFVMLEPNDIMFHPPWDSGEWSS